MPFPVPSFIWGLSFGLGFVIYKLVFGICQILAGFVTGLSSYLLGHAKFHQLLLPIADMPWALFYFGFVLCIWVGHMWVAFLGFVTGVGVCQISAAFVTGFFIIFMRTRQV